MKTENPCTFKTEPDQAEDSNRTFLAASRLEPHRPTAPRVTTNQLAMYDPPRSTGGPGKMQRELTWREKRLVIEEINIYTSYKLLLMDDDIRYREIGAVFSMQNPDQVVGMLARNMKLR